MGKWKSPVLALVAAGIGTVIAVPGPAMASVGEFAGQWTMHQSNGYVVSLDVGPAGAGGAFTGTAHYNAITGAIVSGRLAATDVTFEIHWSDGKQGRYIGHAAGPQRWIGECDQIGTSPVHAHWSAVPA
ncbi:hypothetical protein [Amycolatopsis sp. YIM 10]|uniref:hypothetical protein n=1 Tax=Amycolatopsis sp. YIM 10 TaxID=2653857 RepID=UPI0012902796|nr:hypothetical protein [Amycolatopsis sp. YIM 10]QFU90112.1 hypothetical protein YIM_24675 [Amycolatopsis sp. YIM 10]